MTPQSKRRIFQLSFAGVLLGLFTLKAHAALNFVALGLSLALHALFGSLLHYGVKTVKMDNNSEVSVPILFTPVNEEEVIDTFSQLPATRGVRAVGPFSNVIPASANHRGVDVVISGETVEDFKIKLKYRPSDVGYKQSGWWSSMDDHGTESSAPSLNFNLTLQRWEVTFRPRYSSGAWGPVITVFPAGVECPEGYTYNDNSRLCDLTSRVEARAYLEDKVCLINAVGEHNPFDPDCSALLQQQRLNTTVTPSGEPVTVIADPKGDQSIVAVVNRGEAGTDLSITGPSSFGGMTRQDIRISRAGIAGPSSSTNYPNQPPPVYPGDPGRDSGGNPTVPGTGGGNHASSGSTCGGPNQPPCNIQIVDSEGNVVDFGGGVGDPTEGIPGTMPGEISGGLSGLADEAVLPTSAVCPADAFSFTLPFPEPIGDFTLDDRGIFCSVMSDYGELIRMLSIAAAFIAAMFIVLRA